MAPRLSRLSSARERKARALPALEAAVEDRGGVVAEVPKHPPEARRHLALRSVVRDDLDPFVDSEAREALLHHLDARQGMAAVSSGARAGEIAVEVRVNGARQVLFRVLRFALRGVREVEAAVDDRPVGVASVEEVRREVFGLDQVREHRQERMVQVRRKTQPGA